MTALGLHDCSLDVFHGVRPRGHRRRLRWLLRLLASLPNLVALDLGDNYLANNLGVILAAVRRPLEQLRLACCDFTDADIDSLSSSPHMASLWELDAESCTSGLHGSAAAMSRRLLRSFHQCSSLRALSFTNNSLTDVTELCSAISSRCWPFLESLDVSHNPLSDEEVARLVATALINCRHVREISLPIVVGDGQDYAAYVSVMQAIAQSGRRNLGFRIFPRDRIVVCDSNRQEGSLFR